MDHGDLTNLLDRPLEAALAHLCWALRTNTPWRTRCGQIDVEARRDALLQTLRAGNTPTLGPDDGLALLGALDEHLADQRIGGASLHIRVTDHEPELWVSSRPPGWQPAVRGGDQIAPWMRHHNVVPCRHDGLDVRLTSAPRQVFRDWATHDSVMVAGFTDDATVINDAQAPMFHSAGLDQPEARRHSLNHLFTLVQEHRLRVLVLPELTVPHALRDAWIGELVDSEQPPLLTVSGTYHRVIAGHRRNVAVLTDTTGRVLIEQWKVQPLHIGAATEDIVGSDAVELLEGPWGTLAIAICRDFCEHNSTLWDTLVPDIVLVPSMGNPQTMTAHARRATDLSLAANTLVCMANQPVFFESAPPQYGLIVHNRRPTVPESTDSLNTVRFRVEVVGSGLEQD